MKVVRGLLGWSNKRAGVEFYRWDPRIIPRTGSQWGELLAAEEHVEGQEGSTVIVVVMPRSASLEEIEAAQSAVENALPL